MRALVITPPAPVVSWEDADAHLKLSGDEADKLYVEGLIAAATGHIDGPDGWLGRALGRQTLEARLDTRSCRMRLPYPPVIELESAAYLSATGAPQAIPLGDLNLFGAEVEPVSGTWPWAAEAYRREAVRIRYVAGYADGIPPAIRVAILLMVGDLYRNRVTTQLGNQSVVPMSTKVEDLLAPFRVFR